MRGEDEPTTTEDLLLRATMALRRAQADDGSFRVRAYDLPRHCAAAYFPEANPLVPVTSVADRSQTPAYKNLVVSLAPGGA